MKEMASRAGVDPAHVHFTAEEELSVSITDQRWCAAFEELQLTEQCRLPQWAMMQLPVSQLRLVIRGLWRANGSCGAEVKAISTSDAALRDQLMQALLHCGYSPHTHLQHRAGSLRGYHHIHSPSSSSTPTYRRSYVHSLPADEQLLYIPVTASHDVWSVKWTDPSLLSLTSRRLCHPRLHRQQHIRPQPYTADDLRLWCVAVDHPDHLIVAQRAERHDGVVTKQSRPIVVGQCLISLEDVTWKETALSLIQSYTEQTDGSWIEPKEYAIVWHYENADPEYGRMQAAELQKYLVKILANPSVDVVKYDYARLLEVKPHGISKGLAANAILESLFLKAKIQKSTSTMSLQSLQREATGGAISPGPGSMVSPRQMSRPSSPGQSPGLSAFDFTVPSPFPSLCGRRPQRRGYVRSSE